LKVQWKPEGENLRLMYGSVGSEKFFLIHTCVSSFLLVAPARARWHARSVAPRVCVRAPAAPPAARVRVLLLRQGRAAAP
jgi:hypothetical protein